LAKYHPTSLFFVANLERVIIVVKYDFKGNFKMDCWKTFFASKNIAQSKYIQLKLTQKCKYIPVFLK
jgi:hypothetical protein